MTLKPVWPGFCALWLSLMPLAALPDGAAADELAKIDRVLIDKSDRQLMLLSDGKVERRYRIALGGNPLGHKEREGDSRTPEGLYRIDGKNPESAFHLSLRISYPNAADQARAMAAGLDPGGDIFIHGQPNWWPTDLPIGYDWTLGCIAVTDAEIEEIWALVPVGTVVEIRA
jgi:murein L,D-transpeptidase YafK